MPPSLLPLPNFALNAAIFPVLCSVSQIFISFEEVSLFYHYEHALQFLSYSALAAVVIIFIHIKYNVSVKDTTVLLHKILF